MERVILGAELGMGATVGGGEGKGEEGKRWRGRRRGEEEGLERQTLILDSKRNIHTFSKRNIHTYKQASTQTPTQTHPDRDGTSSR